MQILDAEVENIGEEMFMDIVDSVIDEVFLLEETFTALLAKSGIFAEDVWQFQHVFYQVVFLMEDLLQLFAGALLSEY